MRVLVCGGRDYDDYSHVCETLDELTTEPREKYLLIVGSGRGADLLAQMWAQQRGIPYVVMPALWDAYGKYAGPRRNALMLSELKPQLVLAFPGGRGTADMVRKAREANVEVIEVPGAADLP